MQTLSSSSSMSDRRSCNSSMLSAVIVTLNAGFMARGLLSRIKRENPAPCGRGCPGCDRRACRRRSGTRPARASFWPMRWMRDAACTLLPGEQSASTKKTSDTSASGPTSVIEVPAAMDVADEHPARSETFRKRSMAASRFGSLSRPSILTIVRRRARRISPSMTCWWCAKTTTLRLQLLQHVDDRLDGRPAAWRRRVAGACS